MAATLIAMRCRYCGQTAQRLLLLALIQGAGASAGPDADLCGSRGEGEQHDFFAPAIQDKA